MKNLTEVKFFGRGGQGVVTAAEILAKAVVSEGKWAQAFPLFGPERRGAPVLAFTRISDKPITIRSVIYEPDIIVVLDPTLPKVVDVKAGLKHRGIAVFNSKKTLEEIKKEMGFKAKVATVDASRIAIDILGRPIVNTAILGALAKATRLVEVQSIIKVITEIFHGELGIKNAKAVSGAYEEVKF